MDSMTYEAMNTGQSMNGITSERDNVALPVGKEQIREWTETLKKYKAGKANLEKRVVASENWWKKRNSLEEEKVTKSGYDKDFKAQSGWLHNVIVSKHADAMDSYPEPNILPREEGDKPEAQILTKIIPCILEQNNFEQTYSDAVWQKLKTGTGVYKVFWDQSKLNGIGDISIERIDLLNIFWEPGIKDIQKSKMVFHTELRDVDDIEAEYPEFKGEIKNTTFTATKFLYDDHISTDGKVTVIDVYYHKGKKLHYCKYVGEKILYASENDMSMPVDEYGNPLGISIAERGFYDHGLYPFVFDVLFPVEGTPTGYGFIDICRNSQTQIDLMQTAFLKNVLVGATPRYFQRIDGGINEDELLDLYNPIVHVNGNLGEDALRPISYNSLSGNYISMYQEVVKELRQTSGNTETATGSSAGGVTAASAIAALQEASGKGSRDSTQASYRSYMQIINLCIELIRQFYNMPRKFRIVGQYGQEQFIAYTNAGIQAQSQGTDFGIDLGYRLPVFDIKVSAQKRNAYSKMSQNELAIQFYQLGFFDPQRTDQSLMTLDMMDFDGKDAIALKISNQGTVFDKLVKYQRLALELGRKLAQLTGDNSAINVIAQDLTGQPAAQQQATGGGGETEIFNEDEMQETKGVTKARAAANAASEPMRG